MGTSQPIYIARPAEKGSMSLEETIDTQRLVRDFSPESISRSQLSKILQASSDTLKGFDT